MNSETGDGFQIVRYKKKGKRRSAHQTSLSSDRVNISADIQVDTSDLKRRINRCREEVMSSMLYLGLIETIETALDTVSSHLCVNVTDHSPACGPVGVDIAQDPVVDNLDRTTGHRCESAVAKYTDCVFESKQWPSSDESCQKLPAHFKHAVDRNKSQYMRQEVSDVALTHGQLDCSRGLEQEVMAQVTDSELPWDCSDQKKEQEEFVQDTHQNQSHNDLSIVVYGLGNFASCVISRYQLALVLAIQQHFKINPMCCQTYDPLYTVWEKQLLGDLGFTEIQKNEEGKHRVQGKSLVIMPHCGKALFNNLLWANWSPQQLQLLVVLGNSFSAMLESTPNRLWKQKLNYIAMLEGHMMEEAVKNDFSHTDIFNDLSVHWFPAPLLASLPPLTWSQAEEPVYDTADIEIILQPKN